VVDAKFLSLRVEAFHNSIALTDHVVVFAPIIDEGKNNFKFFSWPGPSWSSPGGFLFHCNTWDRHFFIDTNCLLLVRERSPRDIIAATEY